MYITYASKILEAFTTHIKLNITIENKYNKINRSPTATFGFCFIKGDFIMTKKIILHDKTFGKLSRNEIITKNGIYVYLCLKPLVNSNWTYLPINVIQLNSVLSDVDISNKEQKDFIKTGLKELEEANLIKIISSKKNDYELDLEGMVEKYDKKNPNPYTVYEPDAFKQALKDCGNNKIILKQLSDFFYRLTHNEVSVDMDSMEMYYFNAERESIAESCGIDVRSVDKYNDILVKNKLIYIYKYNYKYSDSGKQLTNVYGKYENKDVIDDYCNKYIDDNKDIIYPSYIPRGKGSKKLMEEAKEAQYSPIEEATDKELAEHDERHKELYAKKMEKEKTVVAESVPMEEVEEVVQSDSKDFDTTIAERKAETNAILSDSSKKETVQADRKHKITIEEFERTWHNKPVQKVKKKKIEKVDEPVETHRVDRDEEYNVLMSELKLNSNTTFDKASKMFDDLLWKKFGFVNETDDDKALKERFKDEWETSITVQKVEPIIEEEENPFA